VAEYSEEEYDQIEAAVLNTARGRWFLSEHARRQRVADTQTVLDAIAKLEQGIGLYVRAGIPAPALSELDDIAKSVALAKQELLSIASSVADEPIARKLQGALALVNFAEERLDSMIAAHAPRVQAAAGEAPPPETPLASADEATGIAMISPEEPRPEEAKSRILVVRRRSSEETHIPLLEEPGSDLPLAGLSHG